MKIYREDLLSVTIIKSDCDKIIRTILSDSTYSTVTLFPGNQYIAFAGKTTITWDLTALNRLT